VGVNSGFEIFGSVVDSDVVVSALDDASTF